MLKKMCSKNSTCHKCCCSKSSNWILRICFVLLYTYVIAENNVVGLGEMYHKYVSANLSYTMLDLWKDIHSSLREKKNKIKEKGGTLPNVHLQVAIRLLIVDFYMVFRW